MANEIDFTKIFNTLDDILASTSFDDVTEDGAGFEQVPDGYYLTEVKKAELTESKNHDPMVKVQLKIVEDGYTAEFGDNDVQLIPVKNTKGRLLFLNFVLKDERSVKRFAADMLKFEDNDGNALLPKEAFMRSETIVQALEILVGLRIYAVVSTTEKDGNKSTWTNLISWKRVTNLGLPA